jgi:hypothetical protein
MKPKQTGTHSEHTVRCRRFWWLGERPGLDYSYRVRKDGLHGTLREQNRKPDVNERCRCEKRMYANLFRWKIQGVKKPTRADLVRRQSRGA